MQTTKLGSTGIRCSLLGFGCSALLGRSGKRESLRALAEAWDSGITLYDTARSYGYGESEALLGKALAGRRHGAVISTKFGIVPVRPPLWMRLATPAARAGISVMPSLRARVRKQEALQPTGLQFNTSVLHESIHMSLRKLGTDYVDLLFLHAASASVLEQDDLLAAMEKLIDSGKVRAAGISAEAEGIEAALERKPRPLSVLQFPCNIFDCSVPRLIESHGDTAFGSIANQPFGGITRVRQSREIVARIAADPGLDPVLREKLDPVDDGVLADVTLNLVLGHRSVNAVVPAMMQLNHLTRNVAAVTNPRFTPEELAVLRKYISKDAI